jgi:hypothetical protein
VEAAGAPVETVEQVAGAIAVAAVADDLVEQAAGLLVLAGGESGFRFLKARGEDALHLDDGGARLLEASAGLGVLRIAEQDAAEDVGRLAPALAAQEVAAFIEESPEAVSLDARQIA